MALIVFKRKYSNKKGSIITFDSIISNNVLLRNNSQGSLNSVIYVDPDAHFRNRSILHSLLPRESSSKVCVFYNTKISLARQFIKVNYCLQLPI